MTSRRSNPFAHWVVTGGVACGKSFVVKELREVMGAAVALFSSDESVHRHLKAAEVIAAVAGRMGEDVLAVSGQIDRQKLGEKVFSCERRRKDLEALLHPLVFDDWERSAAAAEMDPEVHLFVAEVPLYYETVSPVTVDHVVAVLSSSARQMQRLMGHRGLSEATSKSILASQLPTLEKASRADGVIWNDGDLEALRRQVHLMIATANSTHD